MENKGKLYMLRYMCPIFGAGVGALLAALIAWGAIVLIFPSTNIDFAFNAIAVSMFIGCIVGFLLCFRLTRKLNKRNGCGSNLGL